MTKPSIKMMVRKGVVVVRDGNRVRPTIGKEFTFTADERDSILSADSGALVAADSDADSGETADTASTTSRSAEQSQAKATGGRKKATASKSDAENADDGDGNAPDTADSDDDL